MEFEKLSATVRSGRRKGPSRQLRRDGAIPAVCYGLKNEPVSLSVSPADVGQAISGPYGRNVVIELAIDGDGAPSGPLLVMLQDSQYHPVSRSLLHADFLRVALDGDVVVKVPLVLKGRAAGAQAGGTLSQVFRKLPVRCKPQAIPAVLEFDVTPLDLGDIFKTSDLVLDEGVSVELEPNQTLVSISLPSAEEEETKAEDEDDEAEGATPDEGDAAAKEGK